MKKFIGIIATVGICASLAACSKQASQKSDQTAQTSQSQSSQQIKASGDSSSAVSEKASSTDNRWNTRKADQLKAFMEQWGPTMHQSYEEYDGQNELAVSTGLSYPADLSKELVDGQAGLIGWAPNGEGDYEYNVVAIYNHDGTKPPLPNRITYFFAFHDGKPVVLVDQSRDGDPSCHLTTNSDLASHFAQIVEK